MLSITKEFNFQAAHRLEREYFPPEKNREIYGKCSDLHGHTYRLLVTVSGEVNENGMIINFDDLKKIIKAKILDRYDHSFLNELEEYKGKPTTCENMVVFLFGEIEKAFSEVGITLEQLTLFETPTSYAIYKKDA